jgi:hypothetical protein
LQAEQLRVVRLGNVGERPSGGLGQEDRDGGRRYSEPDLIVLPPQEVIVFILLIPIIGSETALDARMLCDEAESVEVGEITFG